MNEEDRQKLTDNCQKIVEDLRVDRVFMASFTAENVFNHHNVEDVMSIDHKFKRNKAFIDKLGTRGPKAFFVFIQTLVKTEQDGLARTIDPVLTEKICDEPGIDS